MTWRPRRGPALGGSRPNRCPQQRWVALLAQARACPSAAIPSASDFNYSFRGQPGIRLGIRGSITTQGGLPQHPPQLGRERLRAAECLLHPRGAAFSSAFGPPHVPPGPSRPPHLPRHRPALLTPYSRGWAPTPVGSWSPEAIVRTKPCPEPGHPQPTPRPPEVGALHRPSQHGPKAKRGPQSTALCPGLPSPSRVCHSLEENHVTHGEEVAVPSHRECKALRVQREDKAPWGTEQGPRARASPACPGLGREWHREERPRV